MLMCSHSWGCLGSLLVYFISFRSVNQNVFLPGSFWTGSLLGSGRPLSSDKEVYSWPLTVVGIMGRMWGGVGRAGSVSGSDVGDLYWPASIWEGVADSGDDDIIPSMIHPVWFSRPAGRDADKLLSRNHGSYQSTLHKAETSEIVDLSGWALWN